MSTKKEFNKNEKVFAKVRGYPAWPAIISGVKPGPPSRIRYNVKFYATGEHATCKPEDLFSYEENKSLFGTPKKIKFFNEALLQIKKESDAQVQKRRTVVESCCNNELLKTESSILNSLHKLLSAFIDQPNYESALESLGHIEKLKITALMLKKNQEVVETIIKVSRHFPYENAMGVNDDISKHNEKASQIRFKAKIILKEFSSLFIIPNGQSFENVFKKELTEFYKETKDWSPEERAIIFVLFTYNYK